MDCPRSLVNDNYVCVMLAGEGGQLRNVNSVAVPFLNAPTVVVAVYVEEFQPLPV